jgi:phage tail-like protein
MPPLKRTEVDPYRNFIFKVEIDGVTQAGFSEVTGYDHSNDVVEYREGNEITTARKLPGLTKYGDVTCTWGLTDSRELWDWRQSIVDGKVARKNVSIVVFDSEGNEKVRWLFQRAWPSKLDAADMNAKGNEVAVMQMTLSHEGMSQGK